MIFLQQETVSIPTAMKHITLLIIITALTLFIIAAGTVYMLFSKKRKQSGKEKEILAHLAQVTDPIKGMMEAEKDPRQKALYRQMYGSCMNIRNLICGDTDPVTESIVQTPAVKEEETAVEQVTETPAEPVKDIPAKGINFRFDEIKMTDGSDKLVGKVIDVIRQNIDNSDFSVEDPEQGDRHQQGTSQQKAQGTDEHFPEQSDKVHKIEAGCFPAYKQQGQYI